jgi:isochorismate pyruvate lyase
MALFMGNLEEVRAEIDRIDLKIIRLLAERSFCVQKATQFKNTTEEVKAPDRVRQVIEKSRLRAESFGLNPDIAEAIYRTIINSFIQKEKEEFQKRRTV